MKITEQQMCDLVNAEVWTKEEVFLDPDGHGSLVSTADGQTLAIVAIRFDTPKDLRKPEQQANAERIVACLNACAGIPTACLQESASVLGLLDRLRYARQFLDPDDHDLEYVNEALDYFEPKQPVLTAGEGPLIELCSLESIELTDDTASNLTALHSAMASAFGVKGLLHDGAS